MGRSNGRGQDGLPWAREHCGGCDIRPHSSISQYPRTGGSIGKRSFVLHAPYTRHSCILLQTTDRSKMPGLFIATGARDKTIKLWDASTGQVLRNLVSGFSCFHAARRYSTALEKTGHDNWVRALVFHPTGKFLLSAADDKTIRVWDLKTGRCTKTVEAHSHFVQCMSWGAAKPTPTADGVTKNGEEDAGEKRINVLATGSVDQSVKIWTP